MTDFGRRVAAAAAANVLPKTGQTTSYRTGDDGEYEKGWEDGDRFTDNEDGTVTDNATSLMWAKDANGDGGNSNVKLDWNDAIDWANALDFAGYDDWRLPNVIEMWSLMSQVYPYFYLPFENMLNKDFRTSTTLGSDDTLTLYVRFGLQGIATTFKIFFAFNVLAVRDA